MRLLMVLICLCRVACASALYDYDSIVKSNYKDLDYFKLDGIDEMRNDELANYPYFNITSIGNARKIITYIHNEQERTEQVFKKRNDCWLSVTEVSNQREHSFIYTFLYNDKAITFTYLYDLKYPRKNDESYTPDDLDLRERKDYTLKDHYLTQVRVYTPLKTITYIFDFKKGKRKVWSNPSVELVQEVAKSNSFNSLVDERVIQGDIVTEQRINNQLNSANKSCYSLRDAWGYKHNIYYMLFFTPTEVTCR
jgi:hypothetical protein